MDVENVDEDAHLDTTLKGQRAARTAINLPHAMQDGPKPLVIFHFKLFKEEERSLAQAGADTRRAQSLR